MMFGIELNENMEQVFRNVCANNKDPEQVTQKEIADFIQSLLLKAIMDDTLLHGEFQDAGEPAEIFVTPM